MCFFYSQSFTIHNLALKLLSQICNNPIAGSQKLYADELDELTHKITLTPLEGKTKKANQTKIWLTQQLQYMFTHEGFISMTNVAFNSQNENTLHSKYKYKIKHDNF